MKNKYLKVAKISEAKFRVLVDCFSEDIAATQAARLSRVNRNTSQRIYTLLRHFKARHHQSLRVPKLSDIR